MVFEVLAAHVLHGYFRQTDHYAAVHLRFPPHGGHRSGHGRAHEFAYSEGLVHEREPVGVGIVVLAHQHGRRLVPLHERVAADVLAARLERLVELSAQQYAEVVVQPASAVVAYVDHEGFLVAVFAEHFGEHVAEALAVHCLDVHVAHAPAGVLLGHLAAAFNPAFVEQVAHCARRCGYHFLFVLVLALVVGEYEQRALAALSGQQREVVLAFFYGLAVNFLNYVPGLYLRAGEVERAAFYYFLYLEPVAVVFVIKERTEVGCLLARRGSSDACSGVRGVQFAEHFAQHFGHVVVIVYFGQEAFVTLGVEIPIHAAEVLAVELVVYQVHHVVEDVFALLYRLIVELGAEVDVLGRTVVEVHLTYAPARSVKVLAVGRGQQGAIAEALVEHAERAVVDVAHPKV